MPRISGQSDTVVFIFSLIALCPLAERLGFVTEQLSSYTNDTVGGLLNATFGNATELIVSLVAINAGLLRVVQLSLLGSILSNILLVLGSAFLAGGLKYKGQTYKVDAGTTNVGLLLVSVLATITCTVIDASGTETSAAASLAFSRGAAVVLLALYLAFLLFQLKTHAHLFADDEEVAGEGEGIQLVASEGEPLPDAAVQAEEEKEDEDEVVLSFRSSIVWLTAITVLIAVLSEWIVNAIEGFARGAGIPLTFISAILLPIVGNAAEHASALIFARKNRMDLALGIAVGSSTQIAVGVWPLCIIVAAIWGKPLSMDLQPFEAAAFLVCVLLLWQAIADGRSHWLKGAALIGAYVIFSIGFSEKIDLALINEDKLTVHHPPPSAYSPPPPTGHR